MAFTITERAKLNLDEYVVRPFSTGMARAFVGAFYASNAHASDIVNYSASNVSSLRRALCQVAGIEPDIIREVKKNGKGLKNKNGTPRVTRGFSKAAVGRASEALAIAIEPLAAKSDPDGTRALLQLVRTDTDTDTDTDS